MDDMMDVFNPYYNMTSSVKKVVTKITASDSKSDYKAVSLLPENPVLAMAYVPFQPSIDKLYDDKQALCNGTLFPCLDKPFMMGGCKK